MLDEDDLRLLATVTGLSARTVSTRLGKAHGNALVRTIFSDDWPEDGESLGELTVATALRAGLEQDISIAAELSLAAVRRRLRGVHGKTLVRSVVSELDDENDDEEDLDDDDEGDDEDTADVSEPEEGAGGGQKRFLDDDSAFTVTELVGAIPVVSLRRSPGLVEWLASRADLTARQLRGRIKGAHGRTLLRTLLGDSWPFAVTGASRPMLAKVTATALAHSPALLRWVADVAGLTAREAQQRVEAAHGNALVARVVPEIHADGDRADEGEDPAEGDRPRKRAGRSLHESVAPPSIGQGRVVDGRYRLKRPLGTGGFGTAWEAVRLQPPERRVVLKTSTDAAHGRLREEIGVAWDLRHPNICAYVDSGHDAYIGTYIVMDYGGTSLEHLLASHGPLELEIALHVVLQAASGLDHAHSRGVIHQDVKPGNILVNTEAKPYAVRLGDFGIAIQGRRGTNTAGNQTVFASRGIGYTRAYAAPEQLRGQKPRTKADQYSLALVLCSMLEGHVFDRSYAPRSFRRLSTRQNAAVARALSEDPDDRFASCVAFAHALGRR